VPKYGVEFYETPSGRSPVEDFLEDLERKKRKAWSKCRYYIERLEEKGPRLIMERQYAEKVADDLYALRPEWGNVEYRLFYTWDESAQAFVLVDAIVKKTPQLTERDKKRALARVKEVLYG
jgi:phage-related protein